MLIAQLSDPHICRPGELYHGVVDPAEALRNVVAQLLALDPAPDLVLLTGDVTEHGEAAEYELARDILAPLLDRLLVLPGNHDEREAFRFAFADQPHLPKAGLLHFAVDRGPVSVIGLDITVPGAHHGEIDAPMLDWLAAELAMRPDRPVFLMLHQPPFESGIGFIDPYRCFGGEGLAALLARHPNVERVLCGHVHRAMHLRFGGTIASMAPSTATAIALRLAEGALPASSLEPPAMLLHHWREGPGTVTHHLPIGNFPGPFNFF